jgi:hypothetical protein
MAFQRVEIAIGVQKLALGSEAECSDDEIDRLAVGDAPGAQRSVVSGRRQGPFATACGSSNVLTVQRSRALMRRNADHCTRAAPCA